MPRGISVIELTAFLLEASIVSAKLYNSLIGAMRIQPTLDPEAGFGAAQAVALLVDLDYDNATLLKLSEQADNPYRLYVTLRASSLGYFRSNVSGLQDAINAQTLDFKAMVDYISQICKRFNAGLAIPHM